MKYELGSNEDFEIKTKGGGTLKAPSVPADATLATAEGMAAALALKAAASDLPYAMVEPGKWTFSEPQGLTNFAVTSIEYHDGDWTLYYTSDETTSDSTSSSGNEMDLSVTFYVGLSGESVVTATRASLPGHLCDRANNLVSVTANTTLTLPPFVAGKVRDLLVVCTIGVDGNDEPWSVIFQGGDGEEISFKAEGDDVSTATFPVPTAAGDWWYSLTERAPHVFAVSLKQLQSVSQPTQTQGGS